MNTINHFPHKKQIQISQFTPNFSNWGKKFIMENLISARVLLKNTLENSKSIASSLNSTTQKLSSLDSSFNSHLSIQNPTFSAIIKDQIDTLVCPAMAVLRMCSSIQQMENSVLSENPGSDLHAYLILIKKLEDALKFLGDNCGLAVQWMEDILRILEEKMVSNDLYFDKINMCVRILKGLKVTGERARFDGGILADAFRKLEEEFKTLVSENCWSPFPAAVLQKLKAILEKLNGNSVISDCVSGYAEIRSRNVRTNLEGLDLSYLNLSVTESDDVQDIQGFINEWCKHLEFSVKCVFRGEYELCKEVFDNVGSDIWMSCFAKIVNQSGIINFLQFGINFTKCKRDPVKLLKLLDVFECLDQLRSEFNWLFAGEECTEIRNLTRELIREVITGACEIFFELPCQVKTQRRSSSPSDGSVPQLVSFVTDYCNYLLDEDYKPLLIKILTINQTWKNEEYDDTILFHNINLVIKEICLNLETWSNAYQDKQLLYLFMMNNHSHFCNLETTKLGILMGDSWIEAHDQYKDYYMKLYLKETWGKIVEILGRDQDQDLTCAITVKKRLKEFNEALDGMYEKQSKWVVSDEKLRLKICKLGMQAFLPFYREWLTNYGCFGEEEVKYTAQGLASMLSSLFQPKIRMYGAIKQTNWVDEVKNIEVDQIHHFTLMAI
ncbi:exocyst complex component EXO70I [Euphorbia lathyris]|uniref:exocyst complex component EXO70I n=1 Tax=Euphorbia lathyris TaxID=212925 RepID=UPI0033131487